MNALGFDLELLEDLGPRRLNQRSSGCYGHDCAQRGRMFRKRVPQLPDGVRLLEQLISKLPQELGGKIVTSAERLQVEGDDERSREFCVKVWSDGESGPS